MAVPQDLREWLPPEHLCWKVVELVGRLDLSRFMAGYRADGQGRAAYPPAVLVALLLYCYSKGIRSTRRIEQACLDDVGCRVITANQQDLAVGRRAANGRPPVPLEAKTVIVRQRARLIRALTRLEHARNPTPVPVATARASLSDPDSRLMLSKRGGFLQGYNLQIVCARSQLLLAIELQDNPADMTALVSMVRTTQQNCRAAGITREVQAWLADNGYASTASFEALAELPLLVAVTSDPHSDSTESPAAESIPAGHRQMAARLSTPTSRNLYKRRGALVEPGFAQPFQRFGRQLHCRGNDAVDTEIKLLGTVHNMNKIFRLKVKTRP
ncbi:transposase [Streptomyces sp. NPDC056653]|uniref:transposase n=1 Tax=Streptomyces sp. NPDC056653 TaxID=3345894 RepID=UPI003694D68C